MKSLILSLWQRSLGRQDLQILVASVHGHFTSQISQSLVSGENFLVAWVLFEMTQVLAYLFTIWRLSIIRQSLAACLLIYGCERTSILATGMVDINDIEDLPSRSVHWTWTILRFSFSSRRKLTVRGSALEDPIIIQTDILTALRLYLQSNLDDVSCLVAKFLNIFLMESPFQENFEVDNFILRNGKLMALWYDEPFPCLRT